MLVVARHQRTKDERTFATLGSDQTLRSLWQRGEYPEICSKKELWAGVAKVEVAKVEAKTRLEEAVQGEEHKVM
jgi:hypothetical protein